MSFSWQTVFNTGIHKPVIGATVAREGGKGTLCGKGESELSSLLFNECIN